MGLHAHHNHDHSHKSHKHTAGSQDSNKQSQQKLLKGVLALNFTYMLMEAIGGWWANSLALLSDAGHMFTDVGAIALSLMAIKFASKPATPGKTYGFYRLEILAALINGVTLIVISLMICYEAYIRFNEPEPVKGKLMMFIAIGGLIINLVSLKLLSHNHDENLNIKGAILHVLGDLLGSVGAIAAGILIMWQGWTWTDPLFSVIISLLIIYSSWRLLSDAVNILLEGTPANINATAVEQELKTIPGVRAVHDLHIWTITSGRNALTAHVVINDLSNSVKILREIHKLLADKFNLTHSTIQIEDPTFDTIFQMKNEK